jgi:hypothetical protein
MSSLPRTTHFVPTPALRSAELNSIELDDNGTVIDTKSAGGRARAG